MMDNLLPASNDPLDRAADALRQAIVPGGPSDEIVSRTLAALHAASETKTIPFYRKKSMRYVWKMAVAGVLAAGVAVFVSGILAPRPPLAFAEIAAKLRDARTLTYKVTLKFPKENESVTAKLFFKEPGRMRFEGEGQIGVTDMKEHKTLILNTTSRTASLIEYKNAKDVDKDGRENLSGPRGNVFGMLEELRKLAGNKSEPVGRKRIGDTEAEGFRVETEGFTLTIWANPKTKTPLLIEIPIRTGDQENLATLSDFQLDQKLDDSLFSLDAPEGYKLHNMRMEDGNIAETVVHVLRTFTDASDGKFPESLNFASPEWQDYLKKRWGGKKEKESTETEAMQFVQRGIRIQLFMAKDKDHGYKAEGVKRGDREKIIFWYRPEKTGNYRAIFGDLHISDVSADQLPEKPKK